MTNPCPTRSCSPKDWRRIHGLLEPVRALTAEERALARALAREFDRLTLLVAGKEPDAPLPERTLAARIMTEYCRLNPGARQQLHEWAKKTVAQTGDGPGPAAPLPRNIFDVDRALKAQVRQLVRKRWDVQRAAIGPAIESHLSSQVTFGYAGSTTVEMQLSSETNHPHWHREMHLATPEVLDFRWRTEEPGAARGYWQLTGPVTPNHPGSVIAYGYLPGLPSPEVVTGDEGVGSVFTIPFSNYLPPTPPQTATTYHLRVLPLGPLQRFGLFNPNGTPVGVGPWSPPAVIRYGKEFEQPGQQFHIGEVYRKAHFFLDWMKLVKDQTGGGAEEYHITGFVHHEGSPRDESGARIREQTFFGPYFKSIDPDDRGEHPFGKQATFHLNNPDTRDWPRTLLAVISILEEEDGGTLSAWQSSIYEIAEEMMMGAIAPDIDDFLKELREEIEEARKHHTEAFLAEVLALLAASLAASVRDYLTAFVTAVVVWIVANIMAGASDDFYGTEAYILTLFTNEVDVMNADAAGSLHASNVASGASSFAGSNQPDGSYRLDQTSIRFNGMGGPLEGSPVSGIVEIGVHWEFRIREQV